MKRLNFAFAISLFLAGPGLFGQSAPATELPPGAIVFDPTMAPKTTALKGPPRPFANPAMQARFDTVLGYMAFPSPLQIGNGYCAMLGDEAGFFLFNIVISNPPLSPAQTLTALDIIHKSFANLLAVQSTANRKPRSTLALLKLFQATAVEEDVKERIATETSFLNALPLNVVAPPMGVPEPPPPPGTTMFSK